MRNWKNFAEILISITISLALLGAVYELSILDEEKYTIEGFEIFKYVKYGNSLDEPIISNLSENERAHLKDVKDLMFITDKVFAISFIIAIFSIILALNYSLNFKKIILLIFVILLMLTIFLYIALKNFDLFFIKFHMLFFKGNWQFSKNSVVIKNFPQEFFIAMLSSIFIKIMLFEALLVYLLLRRY